MQEVSTGSDDTSTAAISRQAPKPTTNLTVSDDRLVKGQHLSLSSIVSVETIPISPAIPATAPPTTIFLRGRQLHVRKIRMKN